MMTPRGRPVGRIPDGMCRVIDPAAFVEVIRQVFAYAAPTVRGGGTVAARLLACTRPLLYRYRTRAPAYVHPQFAANLLHFNRVAAGDWPTSERWAFEQLVAVAIDLEEVGDLPPSGTAVAAPSAGVSQRIDQLIPVELERARRVRTGIAAAIKLDALRVLIAAGDVICPLEDLPLVQRGYQKASEKIDVMMFVFPWDEDSALLNFVPLRRTVR